LLERISKDSKAAYSSRYAPHAFIGNRLMVRRDARVRINLTLASVERRMEEEKELNFP